MGRDHQITPALVQSLWGAVQRRKLLAVAEVSSAALLFLKAAWAEPCLYGGRGGRRGTDIDLLVESQRFDCFCDRLVSGGYRQVFVSTHPVTAELAKEKVFLPPEGGLHIDVHRALADTPWFELPVSEMFAAAIDYPSVDGPVRSLCPEDQVLYAAAHYGNHNLHWDDRHLEDIRRLLERFPVDWAAIWSRAQRHRLDAALTWVCDRLKANGAPLPAEATASPRWSRLRLRTAQGIVRAVSPRNRQLKTARDALSLAALSGRPTGLPRFLLGYTYRRGRDMLRGAGDS